VREAVHACHLLLGEVVVEEGVGVMGADVHALFVAGGGPGELLDLGQRVPQRQPALEAIGLVGHERLQHGQRLMEDLERVQRRAQVVPRGHEVRLDLEGAAVDGNRLGVVVVVAQDHAEIDHRVDVVLVEPDGAVVALAGPAVLKHLHVGVCQEEVPLCRRRVLAADARRHGRVPEGPLRVADAPVHLGQEVPAALARRLARHIHLEALAGLVKHALHAVIERVVPQLLVVEEVLERVVASRRELVAADEGGRGETAQCRGARRPPSLIG